MSRYAYLAATIVFVATPITSYCMPDPAMSYTKRTLTAVKTEKPPSLDGDLSDECWKTAPKAETFIDPQSGKPVADQTVAMVLYDDKFIYVGFEAKDSQPDKVTARETNQDYRFGEFNFDQMSEDALEVGLDPFATHKNPDRSLFAVNAIGT